MYSPAAKDLLACFSPSSEFYAVSNGDGRIKVWDTLRGHLQMEFADIAPATDDFMQSRPEKGHLSLDYTCMQWVQLGKKKKSKHGNLLLVVGTGSGDLLAFDICSGQLKWKISDCHPGGVNAVSFSGHGICMYTAGVDGMVCKIDCSAGNLLEKFKASTKAISSLAMSPDGKVLATAAGQIKVFNCSDNKKIQRFSGHPVGVRYMNFSEDGKYILSSAAGEKFIALWKIDGSKNHAACCALPMEHPAVCLDCKGFIVEDNKDTGLYLLAASEAGACYLWHGKTVEELQNISRTKISAMVSPPSKSHDSAAAIYSAKFQGVSTPISGFVFIAYGSIIKPSFEKVNVQYGHDLNISSSQDSVLLPIVQTNVSLKSQANRNKVTALDRANAEDAIIPHPKLLDYQDKKRKHSKPQSTADLDIEMTDVASDKLGSRLVDRKVYKEKAEEIATTMEDMLRSAGILSNENEINSDYFSQMLPSAYLDATLFKPACSLVEANKPVKKVRETALSMFHGDAFKLLVALIYMWKTRSVGEHNVLPWICQVLVNYSHSILSHESSKPVIDELLKMTRFKCLAVEPLLQLSGRLQLITAQIGKSGQDVIPVLPSDHPVDESDEDDEEIDEVVYGLEEGSSESGDDDDE